MEEIIDKNNLTEQANIIKQEEQNKFEEIKIEDGEKEKLEEVEVKLDEVKEEVEVKVEEEKLEVEVKVEEVKVEEEEEKFEVKFEVKFEELKEEEKVEEEEEKVEEEEEKFEEVKFEEEKFEEKVEEEKFEEVKVQEIDKFDFTSKSIIHILLYLLDNKDINQEEIEKYYKKVSVSLSKEECNLIKTLIYKNNIVFSEIENIIIDSLEKNKLDTHQIILIIQIFYERLHNYKYNIKNKTNICSQILKFIIHTIVIEKQFINISLEEIKEIDKIINSCITLLAFPKIIKEKKCCSLM